MVFSKTMLLMCMRSQNRVTFLYLSRMLIGKLVTITGSIWWILCQTVLPCKCDTLGPYMSSYTLPYSRKIGRFCRMLWSTVCRIRFIGWTVMFWNCLVRLFLFTPRALYGFFFPSTFGMGQRESFTTMCVFLFLIRCIISWQKRPYLVILNVGCCGIWTTNSFPYLLLYFDRWCLCTNPSDRMLTIPFGLYQIGFEYPGRPRIFLV